MKLYYAPGACSLSPHIALREAGIPFDLVKVSFPAKTTQAGEDFTAINPKGAVPALKLDDGELLTEGAAIVQYVADKAPARKLAPAAGSKEHYRLVEWLNYIATELHKGFGPCGSPIRPRPTRRPSSRTSPISSPTSTRSLPAASSSWAMPSPWPTAICSRS